MSYQKLLLATMIVVEVQDEVVVVNSDCHASTIFQPFLPGLICCSLLLSSTRLSLGPSFLAPCTIKYESQLLP